MRLTLAQGEFGRMMFTNHLSCQYARGRLPFVPPVEETHPRYTRLGSSDDFPQAQRVGGYCSGRYIRMR